MGCCDIITRDTARHVETRSFLRQNQYATHLFVWMFLMHGHAILTNINKAFLNPQKLLSYFFLNRHRKYNFLMQGIFGTSKEVNDESVFFHLLHFFQACLCPRCKLHKGENLCLSLFTAVFLEYCVTCSECLEMSVQWMNVNYPALDIKEL